MQYKVFLPIFGVLLHPNIGAEAGGEDHRVNN